MGAILLVYVLAAVQRYITGAHPAYMFPWDALPWLVCVAAVAGPCAVMAAIPAMERVSLSVALDAE